MNEMSEAEIKKLIETTARRVAMEVVQETTTEVVNVAVKGAVKEATKEVLESTLLALGLDLKQPLEIQKDMLHVRSWRTSTETIKRQGLLTAVIIIVTGLAGLIWAAVQGRA